MPPKIEILEEEPIEAASGKGVEIINETPIADATTEPPKETWKQFANRQYERGVSALNNALFGLENPGPIRRGLRYLSEIPGDMVNDAEKVIGFGDRTLNRWDENIAKVAANDPNVSLLSLLPGTAMVQQAKADLPEEGKAEAAASAIASAATLMLPALKGMQIPAKAAISIVSGVLAGSTVNQVKQQLGVTPDTPLADDVERAYAATVKGLGGFALAAGGSKVLAGAARNTGRVLGNVTSKFETFLDKDVQRARALTENPRYSKTRQGVPLTEALKEDDVRPLFEVDAPEDGGSKFVKIAENVAKAKEETGQQIDALLDQIGKGQKVKLKDLDFSDVQKQAGGATEVTARPAREVFLREFNEFAEKALTPEELRKWNTAQQIRERYTAPQSALKMPSKKSAAMRAEYDNAGEVIDRLGNKILSKTEFTVKELREFKSKYDKQGGYASLAEPEQATRAEVYRDLGHVFRKKLGEVIGLDADGNPLPDLPPDKLQLATDYKAANKRFQTLSDSEPLLQSRIREASIEGPAFSTAEFKDRSGSIPKAITGTALPERASPQARLDRADTRFHSQVNYPFLETAARGMRMGTSALEGVAKAGEAMSGQFVRQPGNISTNPLVLPPQGVGASSALGTLHVPAPAPLPEPAAPFESEAKPPNPSSPGIFQSALSALGPQSAMAEEMPAPSPRPQAPMPRESDAFFAAPDSLLPPDLPPEARELIEVGRRSDPLVRRQAMSDLMSMNVIPFEPPAHEWLKGFPVVDGRILDPARVISFNELVLEKEKAGKISLRQSMKIRRALNAGEPVIGFLTEVDPDGEVLPEQPLPEPAPTPQTVSGEEGAKRREYEF